MIYATAKLGIQILIHRAISQAVILRNVNTIEECNSLPCAKNDIFSENIKRVLKVYY